MRKTLVFVCACMACSAAFADTVDPEYRVQWLTSVTEGYYNAAENWTGGEVPANGIDGKYGYINFQANDVTVKAPAEGLVENSGSIFLGTGSGTHTLTLDTRGTYWEKTGVLPMTGGGRRLPRISRARMSLTSRAFPRRRTRTASGVSTTRSSHGSRRGQRNRSSTSGAGHLISANRFTLGQMAAQSTSPSIRRRRSAVRPRSSSAVMPPRTPRFWGGTTRSMASISKT